MLPDWRDAGLLLSPAEVWFIWGPLLKAKALETLDGSPTNKAISSRNHARHLGMHDNQFTSCKHVTTGHDVVAKELAAVW